MTNTEKKLAIAIDIGGTFIKFALITPKGIMLDFWKIPTNKINSGEFIPEEITKQVKSKLDLDFDDYEVIGMGIGIPGFPTLDGIVKFSGNIGWKDYDIKKDLQQWWDIPMFVHNDCDMAALGEKFIGIAKDIKNYVFLTLGTGLGSGIVINGELYQGSGGMAGEAGHIPMQNWISPEFQCTCGLPECSEPIISATGIVNLLKKAKANHPELTTSAKEDGASIWKEAEVGDKLAIIAVKEFSEYLGRLCATLAMLFNPDKIILGGGLAHNNDLMIDYVTPVYERFTHDFIRETTKVELCHVGNDSALYGAAYVVFNKTNTLVK